MCEHFDGAIGDVAIKKRRLECSIAETEYEIAVLSQLRLDGAYAWDAPAHALEDGLEDDGVTFVKELGNAWTIFSSFGEVSHDAGGLFAAARGANVKI